MVPGARGHGRREDSLGGQKKRRGSMQREERSKVLTAFRGGAWRWRGRSVEVARPERVRFQKRDVSTEFQSKKLRTRNLRGNSRLQTFSSLLLPTSFLREWLFIRLTARR